MCGAFATDRTNIVDRSSVRCEEVIKFHTLITVTGVLLGLASGLSYS